MAKKKDSPAHAAYKDYKKLHKPAQAYEGGACMVRCEYIYKENNSCSYRWQALKWIEPGGADRHIYEEHPGGMSGTAWRTVTPGYAKQLFAAGALTGKPKTYTPKKGKKGKKRRRVQGQPFRTAFAPYGNNPHHLLPDATLKDGVVEIAKPAPQVVNMIVQGLLDEKYNLNHFENVMILPTADRDGGEMGLPSHPTNHYQLDVPILEKVEEVLDPYKAVVDQLLEEEEHDVPDSKEIKKGLEEIGKKIHKLIVSPGSRRSIKAKYKRGEDIQVNTLASKVATCLGV